MAPYVETLRGDDTSIDVEERKKIPATGRRWRLVGKGGGRRRRNGCSSQEEIVKELKNVTRQNFITHCPPSALVVLTVTWQLSEVSIVLKLIDGLKHTCRSIGGDLSGVFKGAAPAGNGKEEGNENSSWNGENIVIEASVPGFKIP